MDGEWSWRRELGSRAADGPVSGMIGRPTAGRAQLRDNHRLAVDALNYRQNEQRRWRTKWVRCEAQKQGGV